MKSNLCFAILVQLLALAAAGQVCANETLLPSLPKAVSSLGAATSDGWIYIYGGHAGTTHTYSTETAVGALHRVKASGGKEWEELPGGPAVQGLALVAHGGKIYRVGGMQPRNKKGEKTDNHSLKSAARLDPKSGKWEDLPDLPEARSSHDAVFVGDKLYVVGGWTLLGAGKSPVWRDSMLVLDLAKQPLQWEAQPQPFRRRALTAAAFHNKVYVIAGLTYENETELGVNIYDPSAKTWTKGVSIPGPILNGFTPASCVAGDKLYVNAVDGKLVRLNDKETSWDEVGTVKNPRFVHRMVAPSPDQIVVLGGASKKGNVAVVESITPATTAVKSTKAGKSGMAGEQEFCPIMRTMEIDATSTAVEHDGVKVWVCCATCAKRFKSDPAAYLDVKFLPQLAGRKLPARDLEQVLCPVYRDRVVTSKDPFVMHEGKKIHVFNQAAVRMWNENPSKYADPMILPQLRSSTK